MVSDKELRIRLSGTAVDGKIKCAQALAISKELKTTPKHVGDTLNEMNIKIINCQLGCFP